MRVRRVPLRLLYRGIDHFVKFREHGYANVETRTIEFFVGVENCEVCLTLMDELDFEPAMS